MDSIIHSGEPFPAVDETALLIERAKICATRIIDSLFNVCPPQGNEAEIKESLLKDLFLQSLMLSDDTDEAPNPTTQQSMEDFWLNTWSSYVDPTSSGIDLAKASYLCLLAHSLYTDEAMKEVPAAVAGCMQEAQHVIDRTEIDGNTGAITYSCKYASLYDVVTEYEQQYGKITTNTDTIAAY